MMRESLSGSKRDRAMMQGQRGEGTDKFHFMSMARMTAAVCVLCLLLAACGMSTEEQWQEQYDLGQQYLLDGDYEQAIVAFTAAIGIDPNVADAYLGRAEAYLAGDPEDTAADDEGDVILSEYQTAALADYLSAIELDAEMEEAYLSAAELYVLSDDTDSAVQVLESFFTSDDTSSEAITAMLDDLTQSPLLTQTIGPVIQQNYYSENGNYSYQYEYDDYGNILRQNCYDADGTLQSCSVFTYDEEGEDVAHAYYTADDVLLGAERFLRIDSSRQVYAFTTTQFYVYSADETMEGRDSETYYQYHYDADGQLTLWMQYDPDSPGTVTLRREFTYDSDGNLLRIDDCDKSGNVLNYTVYDWDTKNRSLVYILYDADGTVQQTVTCVLDEYGEILSYEITQEDGTLLGEGNYVYSRDESGNLLKKSFYKNGELIWEYEYDVMDPDTPAWDAEAAEKGMAEGYVLSSEDVDELDEGNFYPLLMPDGETIYMADGDAEDRFLVSADGTSVQQYEPVDSMNVMSTGEAAAAAAQGNLLLADALEEAALEPAETKAEEASQEIELTQEQLDAIETIRTNWLSYLVEKAREYEENVLAHEACDYDDIFTDELNALLGELTASVLFELDDGNWLGLYLRTDRWTSVHNDIWYVYYGEMENGKRSGHGVWFRNVETKGTSELNTYTKMVCSGEWENDSANGWCVYSRNGYEFYEIGFVNGDPDGEGMYYNTSNSGGECEIYAENGSLADLYTYEGESYPILWESTNGGVRRGYNSGAYFTVFME